VNRRLISLGFLALLALAISFPTTAAQAAGKPVGFFAYGGAAVVDWPQGFPAGKSGRTVFTYEPVQTTPLVSSGWDLINGRTLYITHASNAQVEFNELGIVTKVYNGQSHGKFTVYGLEGKSYGDGSYQSSISTIAGCTLYDSGTWAMNSGSAQGHGTFTVCLNFNLDPTKGPVGTFVGPVIMKGEHN